MAASASIPPTPQPRTPRPLIIVVCESVPTSVSGMATGLAALALEQHALGQVLEVHLVDDAGRRRHHAEVVEGLLAPAQELVALAVALELDLGVLPSASGEPNDVHLHRVVHHQVDRHQRVDPLGVAAQPLHRRAHRGEVDDGGHAGEVLEDHAGRHEGQLDVLRRPRRSRRRRFVDVVRGHELAVDVAEHRLEQHLDRERKARRGRGRPPPSRARRDGRSRPGRSRCRGSSGRRTRRSSWDSSLGRGARRGSCPAADSELTPARRGPRDGRARRDRRSAAVRSRGLPDADAARRPRRGRAAVPRAASGRRRRSKRCRPDSRVSIPRARHSRPGPRQAPSGRPLPGERLGGADEHAARHPGAVHRQVEAVVHPVDEVDVEGARRPEERRRCAASVRGRRERRDRSRRGRPRSRRSRAAIVRPRRRRTRTQPIRPRAASAAGRESRARSRALPPATGRDARGEGTPRSIGAASPAGVSGRLVVQSAPARSRHTTRTEIARTTNHARARTATVGSRRHDQVNEPHPALLPNFRFSSSPENRNRTHPSRSKRRRECGRHRSVWRRDSTGAERPRAQRESFRLRDATTISWARSRAKPIC